MARRLPYNEMFPPGAFPLRVARVAEHASSARPHGHEFLELVVIMGGTGVHYTEEERYAIQAGDVFLINTTEAHGYAETRKLSLVNILFDPQRVLLQRRELRKLPGYHALFHLEPKYRAQHQFESRLHLSRARFREVRGLVNLLERELQDKALGYEFMATNHFLALIGTLCRAYGEASDPESRSLLRLAEVLGAMEHRYAEALTLETLADMAHMSTSNFRRTFREATGLSAIDYLIQLRIDRACDLLRLTEEPITEVAFQVGFVDSNYFARQFRRHLGLSPRAFRKREHAVKH